MEENQMTLEEFQSLVGTLEETPDIIQQSGSGLADGDAAWKPSEEAWSLLENVCHLGDLEKEGYAVRIEKLLHEREPFLPDFDGGKLAAERSYNSRNFERALRAFALARRSNVEMIKGLTLDQLNRSGTLENAGTITLGRLLLMMREHDEGHLQDIGSLREQLRRARAPLSASG